MVVSIVGLVVSASTSVASASVMGLVASTIPYLPPLVPLVNDPKFLSTYLSNLAPPLEV